MRQSDPLQATTATYRGSDVLASGKTKHPLHRDLGVEPSAIRANKRVHIESAADVDKVVFLDAEVVGLHHDARGSLVQELDFVLHVPSMTDLLRKAVRVVTAFQGRERIGALGPLRN